MFEVAKVSDAVDSDLKVPFANASLAEILALNRFGIAIAANNAMIATTIMISTNVKPCLFLFIVIPSSFWILLLLYWPLLGSSDKKEVK